MIIFIYWLHLFFTLIYWLYLLITLIYWLYLLIAFIYYIDLLIIFIYYIYCLHWFIDYIYWLHFLLHFMIKLLIELIYWLHLLIIFIYWLHFLITCIHFSLIMITVNLCTKTCRSRFSGMQIGPLAFLLYLGAETNLWPRFSFFSPPIWGEIGVQYFRLIPMCNSEFNENWCSDSNNLVTGINEILPEFAIYFVTVTYRCADKSLALTGNKNLIFLSEWREFPSAPCHAGIKILNDSSRLHVFESTRVAWHASFQPL